MLNTEFENFHINFSNSDLSVNISSIYTRFLGYNLQSIPEGSVSQFFYLGPG